MTRTGAAMSIGLVLFVAGCAGKPMYRGVAYDDYSEALKAQQVYFDKERPQLKAPGIHVDRSIRIAMPNRQYFKTHAVSGTTNENVINFFVDAASANLSTIPEAIRKADVFRDVSVGYYETAEKPTAAGGELVLWLQIPDSRTVTWTLIVGPDNREEKLLTTTGLDQGAERVNIWVKDLAETARKLSQSN